jgi:hypothetical protein
MLYTVFVVVFLLIMMYWALGWWISINENYPLNKRPLTHIILKLLIIGVFFPVVILMAIIMLLGQVSDDK